MMMRTMYGFSPKNYYLILILYTIIILLSLVNCNIIDDGKNFQLIEKPEVQEESPVVNLIKGLESGGWGALEELEAKAKSSQTSREISMACGALGDYYSGISTVSREINLQKAFEYYLKAIQYPFPDIAKAHYMLSFIAYYHPSLVTSDYIPKYKTIHDRDGIEGMDMIEDDPSLPKPNKPENQLITPNIPLTLLHHAFSAKGNYTPGLISFAYKIFHGHYTVSSCTKALDLYRQAAYQIISTQKQNPHIKLSTENVRLEEEFNAARSTITDEEDVIQYYRYSADSGNVDSQIAMGLILLQGDIGGLERDYKMAFKYFQMASSTTPVNPTALSHLAYMYQNGFGTPQDNKTAIELYEEAAREDIATAQTQLGILYLHGWGVEEDHIKARNLFEKAVLNPKSDPEAMLYLGHMYYLGLGGLDKSKKEAKTYFIKSAEMGNLAAMYNTGVLLANDKKYTCQVALKYFRKILEFTVLKTSTTAAYKYYANGLYEKALVHYELAADQGDILAQTNVAWMYEMGIGVVNLVSKDMPKEAARTEFHKKALEFYIKAAEQEYDHPQSKGEAHLKAGDYYYYGWAGQANPMMAALYYGQAYDFRNVQATFNLGILHQFGIGLEKDYFLAKRFYDETIVYNPEAYIPASLALAYLKAEQFLEPILNTGVIYGYAWDNVLIAFLLFSLFVAIIIRQVILLP